MPSAEDLGKDLEEGLDRAACAPSRRCRRTRAPRRVKNARSIYKKFATFGKNIYIRSL